MFLVVLFSVSILIFYLLRLDSGWDPLDQVAMTSSSPIFFTMPVGPVTVLDTDTVSDSDYEVAAKFIATLLQQRKRDGTVMSKSVPRQVLGAMAMRVEMEMMRRILLLNLWTSGRQTMSPEKWWRVRHKKPLTML